MNWYEPDPEHHGNVLSFPNHLMQQKLRNTALT